jgi:hypothetical protein
MCSLLLFCLHDLFGLFQSSSRRWVMISSYNQAIIHPHAFQNSFRARICKPYKEPRNRFPANRASATTLFVVPARQATKAGGVDSSESIPGLHKCLQIRAQSSNEMRHCNIYCIYRTIFKVLIFLNSLKGPTHEIFDAKFFLHNPILYG